jgi:hypothetical protein
MLRNVLRLAPLTWLLSFAAHARANESIQMPPECGTAQEFSRELERLLGDQAAAGRPLSLVISPPDATGAYALRLELERESRELRDLDCRALFRSALVIAAAAVKPDAGDVSAEHPVGPAMTLPPSPKPSTAEAGNRYPNRSGSAVERAQSGWRTSLYAGGGAIAGLLPGVAPMLELGGAATRGTWGTLGALRYLPRARHTEDGRGVTIWALGAQLSLLFMPVDRLRLSGGIAVHRLEGVGFLVAQSTTDSAWSVAPMLEATVIPFDSRELRLEFGLQGYRSIVRAGFEIQGFGEIHRATPFAGAAIGRVAFHL